MSRSIEEQLRAQPCPTCGRHTLELELRSRLVARPLGIWSLAGQQDKTSARIEGWPYAVCTAGDCDFEKAASRAN